MNGRPHESPDCHCAPCVAYDYEQDVMHSYGYAWSDVCVRAQNAYEAERAAWQALINMYDAVFSGDE